MMLLTVADRQASIFFYFCTWRRLRPPHMPSRVQKSRHKNKIQAGSGNKTLQKAAAWNIFSSRDSHRSIASHGPLHIANILLGIILKSINFLHFIWCNELLPYVYVYYSMLYIQQRAQAHKSARTVLKQTDCEQWTMYNKTRTTSMFLDTGWNCQPTEAEYCM
jgi:hypothetical protein